MTTLKEGTPITLKAYYVGRWKDEEFNVHIVRLKLHECANEHDGQLMYVDQSVINELGLESQLPASAHPPANLSEVSGKLHKLLSQSKAENEHLTDVWATPAFLGAR